MLSFSPGEMLRLTSSPNETEETDGFHGVKISRGKSVGSGNLVHFVCLVSLVCLVCLVPWERYDRWDRQISH